MVRKKSKTEIPTLLKKAPLTLKNIFKIIEINNPSLCDDSVMCKCDKRHTSKIPEWKHQIRWALEDLKYHTQKIHYNKKTKTYSLIIKKNNSRRR